MSMSVDRSLSLMEKYRLTAEEFFIIELLFLASSDERLPQYLERYLSIPVKRENFFDILRELQRKKVILASCKFPDSLEDFDPETIAFNSLFLNNYRKHSMDLLAELKATYPSFGYINGVSVHLQNFSKKFDSEEAFAFAYGKAIHWDESEHRHVLELVKWAKDNSRNLLTVNIGDFVSSKLWNTLEDAKSGDNILYFDNTVSI